MDIKEELRIIKRGTEEIISEEELIKKLKNQEKKKDLFALSKDLILMRRIYIWDIR